jgi:hypothetical protein
MIPREDALRNQSSRQGFALSLEFRAALAQIVSSGDEGEPIAAILIRQPC